jgi:hypothetical protein
MVNRHPVTLLLKTVKPKHKIAVIQQGKSKICYKLILGYLINKIVDL